MASPNSLVSGTETSCSHCPMIKHPSFVSGLHPLPASTLPVSELSACQVAPLSSFISDVLFQNPSLQRPSWLGPMLTLWGRVSLSNGWCWLTPENVHGVLQWQRFRDYGKSHIAGIRFHRTLVSLSQYQQMWLLSRVCWGLCFLGGCMASTKCTPSW